MEVEGFPGFQTLPPPVTWPNYLQRPPPFSSPLPQWQRNGEMKVNFSPFAFGTQPPASELLTPLPPAGPTTSETYNWRSSFQPSELQRDEEMEVDPPSTPPPEWVPPLPEIDEVSLEELRRTDEEKKPSVLPPRPLSPPPAPELHAYRTMVIATVPTLPVRLQCMAPCFLLHPSMAYNILIPNYSSFYSGEWLLSPPPLLLGTPVLGLPPEQDVANPSPRRRRN